MKRQTLPFGVEMVLVDPNNTIWQFELGGVHGSVQAWSHGCTIFHMSGLSHVDDVVTILQSFKDTYGSIRVANIKPNTSDLQFWVSMHDRGLVQGLCDSNNQDIDVGAVSSNNFSM